MGNGLQMDSDLVSSACFQIDFQEGRVGFGEVFEEFEMGDGWFS